MGQVFLSYSREDENIKKVLIKHLEEMGVDVWTDDEIEGGANWRKTIDNAIKESFALIVIMSQSSIESKYVTYEWSYALGMDKTVIPLIRNKNLELHPKLEYIQYLDFSVQYEEPWEELTNHLKSIQKKEVDELLKVLSNGNSIERRDAARELERVATSESVDRLLKAIDDEDAQIRVSIISALGKIDDTSVIPELRKRMQNDKNYRVREEIINSLAQINAIGCIPDFI